MTTASIDYGPAIDEAGTSTGQPVSNIGYLAQRQLRAFIENETVVVVHVYSVSSTTFPVADSAWATATPPAGDSPAPSQPADPIGLLRTLKTTTGLSWDLLSRALGVSRRTVYNWLEEAPITTANRQRLALLNRSLLEAAAQRTPQDARDHLLSRDETGVTRLARLASEAKRQAPDPKTLRRTALDLLEPASAEPPLIIGTPAKRPLGAGRKVKTVRR